MLEAKTSSYRFVILVFCWLAAATVYCSITQISPLSPMIIKQFGVSKAAMGFLFSSPLLTFALCAFLGGAISDRLGPKVVISSGITIIAVCAFSRGFATTYAGLLVLNLLMGIGIGLAMPNLPKLTAEWFPPAQRGVATSIFSTGISLGSSFGLMLTLPLMLKIVGVWNKVFFGWGLVAIIVALLMWLLVRNYPNYQTIESSSMNDRKGLFNNEIYRNKYLWIVAAAFFCTCWIFYSFIGWVPTIIHNKGTSTALGGAMAGLLPISGLVANLVCPALSNKVHRRLVFIWGPFLLGIVVTLCMMFCPVSAFWILLPLAGFMLNTPFVTVVFLMPVDLFPRKSVGAATGMIMTVGYLAALLGPLVTGKIWDATGSINGVMISIIIVFAIGAIIGRFFIPEPFKGINVQRRVSNAS